MLLLGGGTALYDVKGHTWSRDDFVDTNHVAIPAAVWDPPPLG
jgi:hypothetical protein